MCVESVENINATWIADEHTSIFATGNYGILGFAGEKNNNNNESVFVPGNVPKGRDNNNSKTRFLGLFLALKNIKKSESETAFIKIFFSFFFFVLWPAKKNETNEWETTTTERCLSQVGLVWKRRWFLLGWCCCCCKFYVLLSSLTQIYDDQGEKERILFRFVGGKEKMFFSPFLQAARVIHICLSCCCCLVMCFLKRYETISTQEFKKKTKTMEDGWPQNARQQGKKCLKGF